jgi:transcriptional regulator with XRE-family HTH domain
MKRKRTALGATIRRLRKERGWTRYGLAKRAGLTVPSVVSAEDRGIDPLWSTVRKLARALGVPVTELDVGPLAMPSPEEAAPGKPGRKPKHPKAEAITKEPAKEQQL